MSVEHDDQNSFILALAELEKEISEVRQAAAQTTMRAAKVERQLKEILKLVGRSTFLDRSASPVELMSIEDLIEIAIKAGGPAGRVSKDIVSYVQSMRADTAPSTIRSILSKMVNKGKAIREASRYRLAEPVTPYMQNNG